MASFHDIAAADGLIATAESSGRIGVWSEADGSLLASFPGVYTLGGRRLALCGDVVVSAGWAPHGVYAYDARSGEPRWQRKDLKEVQHLDAAGPHVAVGRDQAPLLALDVATGETVASLRALRRYAHGPRFGAAARVGEVVLLDGWEVAWRRSVPILRAMWLAVGGEGVLMQLETRAVRCLSLEGEPRWEWRPPAGEHVNELWAVADGWAGTLAAEDTSTRLLRWSAHGAPAGEAPIGRTFPYALLAGGERLVDGEGRVVDARTGELVRRLSAPGEPALEKDGGGA